MVVMQAQPISIILPQVPQSFYPEGYVGEPNQMYIFATAGDDRTPLYQFIQAMCLMTLETSLAAPQMQFMERFQV